MMHSVTAFDFGITELVASFDQDWCGTGASVTDEYLGDSQAVVVVQMLRSDATSLMSGLTSSEAEVLWAAATGGMFRFPDHAASGHDLMRMISDKCEVWLTSRAAALELPAGAVPAGATPEAVAAEVGAVRAALSKAHPQVADALVRCASECSADLAFRLLFRVLNENMVPLSAAQYQRFPALGEAFGYGEYVVSDVEYLVE